MLDIVLVVFASLLVTSSSRSLYRIWKLIDYLRTFGKHDLFLLVTDILQTKFKIDAKPTFTIYLWSSLEW